ncbi:MAG: VIT and VWA domain-containing protein [Verrucomicrobiota bacterium]|nr:VIT and VWA domain-containing protein [Verrucomicrobiota bacterium]
MKTSALLCAAWLLALTQALHADGFIIIHNPPDWPHHHIVPPWPHPPRPPHPPLPPRPPRPPRPYVFAPLEVVFHKVDVSIDGQKATTRVEQEFFNPNEAVLEGEYLFPIPKGAHIDKFTMRIGDRDMEAELLDANKARAIYEDIVRKQRDPALLEYTGRNAFRVRIFPIEPRSRKKVTLTYTELLKADAGLVSYLYPLNTEKFSAQPLKTVAIKVSLAQESPLKALYSPTHSVEIRRDGDRRATVGYEASNIRPDQDFQLLYSTAEAELGIHLLTHKTGADEGWFLLLASPGADVMKARETNPKDVVFVLDTSGSMAGKKLEQAKKALSFCIENLNDNDRFEIVRFSTEAELLFEKLQEASRAQRDRALDFIKNLRPIGGTAIADALGRAVKLRPAGGQRPFVVVFLTDGQPTVGETNEDKIAASVAPPAREGETGGAPARIFCFGIGTDINTHLLDKVTERTGAASQYVLPEEDLEVKVSSFFTKIKEPLLTSVKIKFPDSVRTSKLYPSPVPDLFRGDQLMLTGRYSGSGEGVLELEGLLNGEVKRLTQRVKFSDSQWSHEFIPQLWAMRRVGWLLDEIRLRGESRELREEVVELARRYAIVTPYTSYLIVEDEARRNVPLTQRSLQLLDRNRGAQAQIAESWSAMPQAKAGEVGSFTARSNARLKNADALGSSAFAGRDEAKKAIVASRSGGSAPVTVEQLDAVEQQVRVVNGKSFFQNREQWLDTEAQKQSGGKNVRVQFASEEYFDLLAKNSELAPWLALGANVRFSFSDTLYVIFE